MIPMRRLLYVTVVEPRQPLDRLGVILQRMAAGIESQRFFLESQTLFFAPGRDVWKRRFFDDRGRHVGEQTCLPGELVALRSRAIFDRLVQNGHHRSPVRSDAVECARFYERFEDPLIHGALVDSLSEIVDGAEWIAIFSRAD